jgi:hypothetical protein
MGKCSSRADMMKEMERLKDIPSEERNTTPEASSPPEYNLPLSPINIHLPYTPNTNEPP